MTTRQLPLFFAKNHIQPAPFANPILQSDVNTSFKSIYYLFFDKFAEKEWWQIRYYKTKLLTL